MVIWSRWSSIDLLSGDSDSARSVPSESDLNNEGPRLGGDRSVFEISVNGRFWLTFARCFSRCAASSADR